MRKHIHIGRWVLTAWIMLWGCMSSALAYDQNTRYNPYSNSSISPYGSYNTTPTYQFRSTSPYQSVVNTTSSFTPLADDPYAGMARQNGPRRAWDWGAPGDDDDPIGVIPDQPVGEPLVLLLMALLYIGVRFYRSKRKTQG